MPSSKLPQTAAPEFTKVPTEDVLFDNRNPRLGGSSVPKSQPGLQAVLMGDPHLAGLLIDSFVENGFIEYEPLVVRQTGARYVVIEGNRRLAAVKHIIANPDLYPRRVIDGLKKVPVLIFKQRADESHLNEMRTYLGVRHLLGLREWPAESKAVFLDENIKTKSDLKRIQHEFAMKKADIRRYLIPYRVKKAAASLLEDIPAVEDQSFWTLGEALQRAGIKEYIKLDVDPDSLKVRGFDKGKFEYLLEFLYGSARPTRQGGGRAAGSARITETRQLSRLSRVLANKRGSEKLEKGSTLEEAELYVSTPAETIDGLISDLRVTLQRIIALGPSNSQQEEIERYFKDFLNAISSL